MKKVIECTQVVGAIVSGFLLVISMIGYNIAESIIYFICTFALMSMFSAIKNREYLEAERIEDIERNEKELFDKCMKQSADWYDTLKIVEGE